MFFFEIPSGFADALSALLRNDDPWFARSVGGGLVILLLTVNIAGVKYVSFFNCEKVQNRRIF